MWPDSKTPSPYRSGFLEAGQSTELDHDLVRFDQYVNGLNVVNG